jgi:RNA polymerase sigma-70 factor (ECF subfamily)
MPVTTGKETDRVDTTTVWRDLHDPLLAYIARRVGHSDAEDVLQDVMLRTYRHEHELDHLERVTGWVYRVATNAITDYYRSGRRREHPTDAEIGSDGVGDESSELDRVGAADAQAELATCLRPMVDDLPTQYREAILLTEYQGVTQMSAAAATGLSVSGMKTRVQRARRQLKQSLTACCAVELDRRGAVISMHPRGAGCSGCGPNRSPDRLVSAG